jgi:Na+/H+-dicarboxylate symporter
MSLRSVLRSAFTTKLYVTVLVAIVLGAALGLVAPGVGASLEPVGTGFIGVKALAYFEIGTTVALVAGLVVMAAFGPGRGIHANPQELQLSGSAEQYLQTGESQRWYDFPVDIIPDSVVSAFVDGNGAPKRIVSLVVPSGYAFNGDGVCLYLGFASLFIAQAFDVELSVWQQIGLLAVFMITSKGSAGVAGAGFVILAATLSTTSVVPVVGIMLILGVDRFLSTMRGLVSLSGQIMGSLVVARWEKVLDIGRARAVLNREPVAPLQDEDDSTTEADVAALRDSADGDDLVGVYRAARDYADAMTQQVQVPPAVFATVREHFDDRQIVELTATVAAYNLVSRFLVAVEVGHDEQGAVA